MLWIKICGITCLEDARLAAEAGADALGFVFEPRSRRYIGSQADWQEWVAAVPATVQRVLVVAEVETAPQDEEALTLFQALQCYAPPVPDPLAWRATLPPDLPLWLSFRVKAEDEPEAILGEMQRWAAIAARFLLDTYNPHLPGGTGRTFNWKLAQAVCRVAPRPTILAGGLTPDNVRSAVQQVQPFGVDVSSGVESEPGKKDPFKLTRFIEQARRPS